MKKYLITIFFTVVLVIVFIVLYPFIFSSRSVNQRSVNQRSVNQSYSVSPYSQINQDLDVLEYLNYNKNGYFIDIGATDGIAGSNSYLLEKEYGWNGICIEPQNDFYNKLIKNRSCHTDNSLLFSKKGKEFDFSNAKELGGITEYISDMYKYAKESEQVKKISETLNNILIKYNAPYNIDYMSLDTEGTELEILKGIDFDTYTFSILNVEHNSIEPARTNIRNFLENKNYKFYKENDDGRIVVDDFYIYIK